MAAAIRGSVFGKVGEHLHSEAAVEAIGDLPPPQSPHDLRRHATRGSGLGVDQSASLYRWSPDYSNRRGYLLLRRQAAPGQYRLLQSGEISQNACSII